MADDQSRVAHVSHPILRLEVVGPDGERRSEHRVFCRLQERSVAVGTCCACAHCDSVKGGPFPAVDCTITLDEATRAPDPLGVRTAVGTVLDRGVVAIDPGTTVRDALILLRSEDRRSIAVVDASGHTMLGVVHEATFVPSSVRARSGGHPEEQVGHVMSGGLAIHEALPIRKALALLAGAHLREATVVDDEGVPLGVFRDIDGMRWLVVARDESGG